MGIIKSMLIVVGTVAMFFAIIPTVLYRFVNAGVVALFILAVICFLQVYLLNVRGKHRQPWEVFSGKGRFAAILRRTFGVVLVVFTVAELLLSAAMIKAYTKNTPAATESATAVVLGCKIIGDKPSKMLQNRLEKALDYLNKTPDAKVVVTGGLGKMEDYTEADVEAKWLIANGIAPERIIIEKKSQSTQENIKNTADLLKANNLPMRAVLFTDGFHQMRSQLYARANGIEASGVPTATPWGLLPCYWLREQMAICEAAIVLALQ